MKTQARPSRLLLGLFLATPLFAQEAPPPPTPAVPALESAVNIQIVLTTTGEERSAGPAAARVHAANVAVTRMNTKDFVALLDEKYDLVAQPKDFDLVAVLVDTETEDGYRFYLKNSKPNGEPRFVYLAPEIAGLRIDASATRYREVQNGDTLLGGSGVFKHAVSLSTAGFTTQGVASGGYRIRDITVEGVTARLSVSGAIKGAADGFFVENADTDSERTYVAETRWVITPGKPVDLNDYPAPPPPPPPVVPPAPVIPPAP